jgi:hypothetical protein
MATKEIENKNITGLDTASDRKEAELSLVEGLLAAAAFKEDDGNIAKAHIVRNKQRLFTVRLHPISDKDSAFAKKKATIYMPNPNNKKLPPIEKEVVYPKFTSWLIYLATVEEDQEQIWGNPAIMQNHSLAEPWESVDVLLTAGEKSRLINIISELSGMDDDDVMDDVEFAKNA